MKIGQKIPMELQLVDYCTDEVVFTSYIAPRMDRFSLINVPCTYQPAPCEDFPADEQEECKINKADWLLLCSETEGFWSKYVSKHVCSKENYLAGNLIQPDGGKMRWIPPEEALAEGAIPATVGGCDCDYSIATNGSSLANLTAGVPASFIKVGMSIFYVQMVVGGRKTYARDDPDCQKSLCFPVHWSPFAAETIRDDPDCPCDGPLDTSVSCVCALGSRKVPYIYNNSFMPHLTALISVKSGQLIYKNTYIKYNFEDNGIGCVACTKEYCWGSPAEKLRGWIQEDPSVMVINQSMSCVVPRIPDLRPGNELSTFCRYPASKKDIDLCSLKVYVAWVGTDGYGQGCDSHNKMFSRFTQMGVSNVAMQAYDGLSKLALNVETRVTGRDGAIIDAR
ncbi:hypothetical protein T484DRAFT_1768628 [Baffinella frigidus]|nr:hypothetical protein T484DRAFT_1768628 [Cryptophyta sp. CCMP2293]